MTGGSRNDAIRAYLAVGSNLGDRRATILGAIDELARVEGIAIVAVSTLIETEPVEMAVGEDSGMLHPGERPDITGDAASKPADRVPVAETASSPPAPGRRPGAPGLFLNGAVVIDTTLAPHVLLETLLAVEARFGRRRAGTPRNASRTLDLDILLYGDRVIRSPNLTVPHPRMHERRFVLAPLAEVAPEMVHPLLGCRVQSLLASLDSPPSGTSGSTGISDGRPCSSPLNRSTKRSP